MRVRIVNYCHVKCVVSVGPLWLHAIAECVVETQTALTRLFTRLFSVRIVDAVYAFTNQDVCRILAREVDAPLPPEAKIFFKNLTTKWCILKYI